MLAIGDLAHSRQNVRHTTASILGLVSFCALITHTGFPSKHRTDVTTDLPQHNVCS